MRFTYKQRRLASKLFEIAAGLLIIYSTLEVLLIRFTIDPVLPHEKPSFNNERIFISSILWTDEIILKTHWNHAIVELAQAIGRDNVFVSIEESGSLDDTKGALSWLEYDLERAGIPRSIMLDATSREEIVEQEPEPTGWITMPFDKPVPASPTTWTTIPKHQPVPRRIPYLAGLRNKALSPLFEMAKQGKYFDKILFLNDIVFTTEDVRRLFSTRNGDYATACALDFKRSTKVYDTFALRDSEGHEPMTEHWPYFRGRQSRTALKHSQPIPVSSCWNGMLIMDAAPFYDENTRLKFRGISDSLGTYHLEGSESCLIHTDNPLSKAKGVWVNPNVRVGYSSRAYDAVNQVHSNHWLSTWAIFTGLWQNRIARWTSTTWLDDRMRRSRLDSWQEKYPSEKETGEACLIDETQILIFNGWAHI